MSTKKQEPRKISENEYEVDLHDYGYCVKNGYMFAYLDKDCTYWISKSGKSQGFKNGTIPSISYSGSIPNKKFRVALKGNKCTVVEFENNYEQERNATLWYALYIDGKISHCGLLINSKYFMFKKFKDDMMREYEYDYDVEKGEIIENKREVIYQGKYKNNSYEHYPRDESANEKEDKRSQTSSISPVNNPADNVNKRDADPKKENVSSSIPVIQKKNDGSEIKRLSYGKEFKELSLCIKDKEYDDVQEIQVLESGLPIVTTLTIMDIQSLETIVFNTQCCNSLTNLKISNLPKLKRITFGDSCFKKATKVDLIDLPCLEVIEMGSMVFGKDTACTFDNLPQLTTIKTNGTYMFLMKRIDVQDCPMLKTINLTYKDNAFKYLEAATIINCDALLKLIKEIRPKISINTA